MKRLLIVVISLLCLAASAGAAEFEAEASLSGTLYKVGLGMPFFDVVCSTTATTCGSSTASVTFTGTTTFSGPLSLERGTAGAPTLGWRLDADGTGTGFWSPATGLSAHSVNGAEVVRFGSGAPSVYAIETFGNAGSTNSILKTSAQNGTSLARQALMEVITLNTAGTTTDSTLDLPANSILEAVVWRVTTTITTAANFSIGDPTTPARFVNAATTLTAGSTGVGLLHWEGGVATNAAGPVQNATAKIRITTNVNPGAGVIRVIVFVRTFTAPNS